MHLCARGRACGQSYSACDPLSSYVISCSFLTVFPLPSLTPPYLGNPLVFFFPSHSGKNGGKGGSGASDDDLASDVLSHYSSASESASVLDEGTGVCVHTHACTHFSAPTLLIHLREVDNKLRF